MSRLVLFMINLPTTNTKAFVKLTRGWNRRAYALCTCTGGLMFDVRHLSSSVEIIDIKSGINSTKKCKMRPFLHSSLSLANRHISTFTLH